MSDLQPWSLAGRVALVTGAGVGIGRATAIALARAGAAVGVHYHASADGARQTVEAIRAAGGTAHLLQADLTIEAEANRVVDQLIEVAGRLDILFNNAGSPLRFVAIEHCPTDLWRQVFDVNVTTAFFVTRRAIPHLRASGCGSVINNLSLSVQTGGSGGGGVYAAAKGALQVMTRTLARELAPQVRQNGRLPPPNAAGAQRRSQRHRRRCAVPRRRCVALHDRSAARHQRRPILAVTRLAG
jgi:3-oxoacyl-[acyl-carrier protein] reductase